MPAVYMRHDVSPTTRKATREIVDGQQRLKTIFNFIDDGFKVMKIHNDIYGGLYFSQLPPNVKTDFLQYDSRKHQIC